MKDYLHHPPAYFFLVRKSLPYGEGARAPQVTLFWEGGLSAMLKTYFQVRDHSLLRGPYAISRIRLRSSSCQASTLPAGLSLQPFRSLSNPLRCLLPAQLTNPRGILAGNSTSQLVKNAISQVKVHPSQPGILPVLPGRPLDLNINDSLDRKLGEDRAVLVRDSTVCTISPPLLLLSTETRQQVLSNQSQLVSNFHCPPLSTRLCPVLLKIA